MRVTDMRGVDLARYTFDFDLTFAVLLAHPDGRVYHRYGGRDHREPDRWMGLASFERLLWGTLVEHDVAEPGSGEIPACDPLVIEEIPAFAKRDKGECVHCHSVFPALHEEARTAETWSEDDRWVYPPPSRIGVELDPANPSRIVGIAPGSFAAAAGLRKNDWLLRSEDQWLLTFSDLSYVLHRFSSDGGELPLEYERDGRKGLGLLKLPPGWKRGTPLEFSWRASKWGFNPAPGFGGQELSAAERRTLGLDEETFAFRVGYLVTWGENRRFGQEAARAGLRDGDVFLSAAGVSDFESHGHFHSWWRLTRVPGDHVGVVVLRDGKRLELELEVLR